ncbi:MAG: hypothetical protein PHG97_06380, partial [Candidatus Margulisbacteria bacterium]|nr:hypothetical protein [Candidatus Margulisiibacteriota bacterium]
MKESLKRAFPPLFLVVFRAVRRGLVLSGRQLLALFGYNVARINDYYSPLPAVPELKKELKKWYRPSSLAGLKYNVDDFKERLSMLMSKYYAEFLSQPSFEDISKRLFGPGYTQVDALVLYSMLKEIKPKRYLEVGSGVSTYYAGLAAAENKKNGAAMQITCIEPYPHE